MRPDDWLDKMFLGVIVGSLLLAALICIVLTVGWFDLILSID